MITFTTAPIVAPGEKITSAQNNQRVAAFNDRLRAGFDATWRLWWKVFGLTRAVRNPDGFAYPAADEWLSHYMNIPSGEANWGGAPGTASGENVANPLMAFIHGALDFPIDDEAGRLIGVPMSDATGAEACWELGKTQRGAIDPDTGAEAAPALMSARKHRELYKFAYAAQSWQAGNNRADSFQPYLQTFGGMLPHPVSTGNCTDNTGVVGVDFDLFFTNLKDASVATYTGQCGPGTAEYNASNVASLAYLPDRYRVTRYSGEIIDLPYSDWVEGPYLSNGVLGHVVGGHIDEMLHAFVQEFRGSDASRAGDDYKSMEIAFDFQKFLTTQYYLAPAQGTDDGAGGVEADYPSFNATEYNETSLGFEWVHPATLETFAPIKAGMAVCGVLIRHGQLSGTITLQLRSADAPAVSEDIVIGGSADPKVVWFEKPYAPHSGAWSLRVVSSTEPVGFEGVTLEFAVLEKRKPDICDAYLVARLLSTTGTTGRDADGTMVDAKRFSDSYFNRKCLLNSESIAASTFPNDNPIHEATRRMIRDNMRLVKRANISGYAVEGGKTVLWFARKVNVGGALFDLFDGIAPSLENITSGELREGFQYIVTGTIEYEDETITDSTFTATDVNFYTGTGTVKEYNIIRADAPKTGWSNEWLMFLSTSVYSDSDESNWKLENYGDVNTFMHNRCHFYSAMTLQAPDLHSMVAPGQSIVIDAESPSALNYYKNLNANYDAGGGETDRRKFFKSCQIYRPDYEIESCIMDGGEVKMTFKTRFQHSAAAPAGDFGREMDAATREAVHAERSPTGWRTDENAIREYLIYANGGGECRGFPGDASGLLNVEDTFPVNIGSQGSCIPRFYFTKLIEKAYEETPVPNEEQEPHDTRVTAKQISWQSFLLDAMCEAYVDRESRAVSQCPIGRPITYTLESLMYQAAASSVATTPYDSVTGEFDDTSGGSFAIQGRNSVEDEWQTLATATSSPWPVSPVMEFMRVLITRNARRRWFESVPMALRPDRAQGFGPLPTVKVYADTLNLLSAALNLLVEVPVDLPWDLESRRVATYNWNTVTTSGLPAPTGPCTGEFRYEGSNGEAVYGTYEGLSVEGFPNPEKSIDWRPGLGLFSALAVADGAGSLFTEGGRDYYSGIATSTREVASVTVPSFVLKCEDGNPSRVVLAGMSLGEMRLSANQPALDAIPDALLENIEQGYTLTGYVTRTEYYWERGGAPLNCTGTLGEPATRRSRSATLCATFEMEDGVVSMRSFLFGSSPTVTKTPLAPSFYHSAIGFQSVCPNGPRTEVAFNLESPPQFGVAIPLV